MQDWIDLNGKVFKVVAIRYLIDQRRRTAIYHFSRTIITFAATQFLIAKLNLLHLWFAAEFFVCLPTRKRLWKMFLDSLSTNLISNGLKRLKWRAVTASVASFKFFVSKPSICLFYSLPFWWFAVFWGLDCMVFTFLSNTFSPLSVTIKNPTDKVQDHRGSNPRLLGENCYFFHLRCAFTLPPQNFFLWK